jgi:hypothetical protein
MASDYPLWYLQTFLLVVCKHNTDLQNISSIFLNNPKGASFKENRLMTTARNALRTTFIFRFSTYENNLNFLNQSKWQVYDIKYMLVAWLDINESGC